MTNTGIFSYYPQSPNLNGFTGQKTYAGTFERILDVNNPAFARVRWYSNLEKAAGRAPVDLGGPLWKETVSITAPTVSIQGLRSGSTAANHRVGSGFLYPSLNVHNLAKEAPSGVKTWGDNVGKSALSLYEYGADGIARCLPTVPPVSLFQFLGEVREGLPKLPGSSFVDWDLVRKNIAKDPSRIRYLFAKGSPFRR